jgi:oligoribonuclease
MPGNMTAADNLVWIDLEMTGLDPDRDRIIEIATIVTNRDLDVVAEGPVIAVRQPEPVLESMDEWNRTTHGGSGLLARVRASTVPERVAELATIEFLAAHTGRGTSPMCGNSICQDRRFLARHMPELERWFHYRNVDVSTLKELARRWAPDVLAGFTKKSTHLALDDIRDSIAELRYYRGTLIAEAWRGP